jgi:hypothetical protein
MIWFDWNGMLVYFSSSVVFTFSSCYKIMIAKSFFHIRMTLAQCIHCCIMEFKKGNEKLTCIFYTKLYTDLFQKDNIFQ